jgi:hypothetical protein
VAGTCEYGKESSGSIKMRGIETDRQQGLSLGQKLPWLRNKNHPYVPPAHRDMP